MMDLLACDYLILAEKLRNEDPEQFYTLVKMHLSFVLDLNVDESDNTTDKKCRTTKWNLPFSKKSKPYTKTCTEGSHLTPEFMDQIRHLISFLSLEENISQEGIFRRSGKVTRQQELKSLINQGIIINLNDGRFSVHDCATVLKNILSELPESVLTDAHFPAYWQIADLCKVKCVNNEDRLLKSLQLLILLLPTENRIFFRDIIALLHLAASHEDKNRMSADNLATLFTPHLLCPRKLSPEALHMNSQVMSRVVAFMIQKGGQLFEIPLTLATDLQAYWNKKERRKLSPLKQMSESVCDGTAANTVFTFVDRERTAQENVANPTETALAQLYAYIQSLPESSKKRKLIKQFNKENGHGTPLRANGGKKRTRSRSLGDSIKKHLPVFTKNPKRAAESSSRGEDDCNSPVQPRKSVVKSGVDDEKLKEYIPVLKQSLINSESISVKNTKKIVRTFDGEEICENENISPLWITRKSSQKRLTFDNDMEEAPGVEAESIDKDVSSDQALGASSVAPAKKRNFSPPVKSVSPRKLSCNAKSDTNLDKIRIAHQDISHHWPVSRKILQQGEDKLSTVLKVESFANTSNVDNNIATEKLNASHKTPRKPATVVDSQGFVEPNNIMKSPSLKFTSNGSLSRFTNDFFISSPNNTNRIPIRYCSKSHLLMTSTPAPGNGCIVTPIVDKNNSMSPITRSTQRMPKAMQETMMTPRSRKPVISLSGTDLCNLASVGSFTSKYHVEDTPIIKGKKGTDFGKKLILEDEGETHGSDSLSSTFRDYLFSRSVLSTSPVDLSFSSRTDDFLSFSDNNSSGENDEFKSILNEEGLSESLLYCLDGNEPDNFETTDEKPKLSDNGSTYSEDSREENRIYETAL